MGLLKLEVREAVRKANVGVRRFPVQFCLPLVVSGVATSLGEVLAHRFLGKSTATWVGLIVVLGCVPMTFWAELLTSSLYIAFRKGKTPSLGQVKQVARFEGLWWVMWGLLVRYVCGAVIGGMSLIVVGFLGLMGEGFASYSNCEIQRDRSIRRRSFGYYGLVCSLSTPLRCHLEPILVCCADHGTPQRQHRSGYYSRQRKANEGRADDCRVPGCRRNRSRHCDPFGRTSVVAGC